MTSRDRRGQTVPLSNLRLTLPKWPASLRLYPLVNLVLLLTSAQAQVDVTKEKGITTFWYNSSNTDSATYVFPYCQVNYCANKHYEWGCNRVGTPHGHNIAYICVTSKRWGDNCDYWGSVGWNVGARWGYDPMEATKKTDRKGESLLTRMTLIKKEECHDIFILNIKNPQPSDAGTYVLGDYGMLNSPRIKFYLKDMFNNPNYRPKPQTQENPLTPHITTFKEILAIANPSFEDTLAIETGFSDVNLWLEWMKYNADKHNKSNCYVCAGARPHLGTVPLNIPSSQDECFLSLYTAIKTTDSKCERWKREYPILSKNPNPGNTITPYPGNYTCYVSTNTAGRNLRTLPPGYCSERRNTTTANHTRSLGDIYWLCGDMKLRTKLDTPWRGECALAKIIMPLHIVSHDPELPSTETPLNRRKREVHPVGSLDPHVYIDSIGVPRGVPNEFKARDQVAAGFESFVLPLVTINKNVDWINYIYYNQQRFVNYTKEALVGIAEQLEATSQMTFQNRMALDMILAEKGGTCVYIDKVEGCCSYIPDHSGPNGKTTLAIQKLEELSVELKRNSGLTNPWDQYFGFFNNWKQALVQIGIYLLIIVAIFIIVFFCILPCCKRIATKSIDSALMYETIVLTPDYSPAGYQQYLAKYRAERKNHIIQK